MQFTINLLAFTLSVLLVAQAATTHKHDKHNSKERIKDGVYQARDAHHNEGGEHHVEFDHEAILGSVKEAEEFDTLDDNEAKRRLGLLVIKMDLNKDGFVDRHELKAWILRSFKKLAEEEAYDSFVEMDDDNNDIVTWHEFLTYTYGSDNETNFGSDEIHMLESDKLMFFGADLNKDGHLIREEFVIFQNPEESPEMLPLVLQQTLHEKDINKDSKIDFKEYLGDEASQQNKDWLISAKETFDELDKNTDGFLVGDEILSWIVPSQDEVAVEEVDHLFVTSDTDHDDRLSYQEIIGNHETFVGSEATDYGEQLENMKHFDDEL